MPSPEQTMGGTLLYRAVTTWNSMPHQVTHASSKITIKVTDEKNTLWNSGDCEATQTLAQTHTYTYTQ